MNPAKVNDFCSVLHSALQNLLIRNKGIFMKVFKSKTYMGSHIN